MKFQFKGFVSLLLTLAFLALAFSGVILYMTPRGRVANWTGWTMLGLEKPQWQSIHVNIALLFLIVAGFHLFLNWTMFWGYIKKKVGGLNLKAEMLIGVAIVAFILVGAVVGLPPFSTIMAWNEEIKDYWEQPAEQAPTPHAEELTLEQLAGRMHLAADEVAEALRKEGIAVAGVSTTIADIARQNGKTPKDIYAAIQKHFPDAAAPERQGKGEGKGMGKGQGRGMGKGQGRGMGKWQE